MKKLINLVIVCLLVQVNISSAQEAGGEELVYKAVGIGAAFSNSPYVDDDSRLFPLPAIVYMSESFYFTGLEAGYALAGDREEGIGLYATVSGRLEFFDEEDSYIFDGMGNRHASMDGGLKLKVNKGDIGFELGAKYDMLGVYDGYELSGEISRKYADIFECDGLDMTIGVGLDWRSENLNDYYFGVADRFATAGRPAYSPSGGFNSNIGLTFNYQLDEKWSLYNSIRATFLGDDITDSPLVDKDVEYSVMIGLMFRL